MNGKRIYENLLKLCAVPSVGETEGEKAFPGVLAEILKAEIPAFARDPELVKVLPCPVGRSYVHALLPAPADTKKTVILLSHFDVVGTDDFGEAASLAFDPEGYTAFLKKGGMILPEDARADLDAGWLFGRGTNDMKFGIAADIEILRYFDAHPDEQKYNILLLSVPDEEKNSAGMLAAVEYLAGEDLDFRSCVVSEADITPIKRSARTIHLGAAGKIMPMFYCFGKETHVGEPFSGFNPALLCSCIALEAELSPELIDMTRGVSTPAPTCLKVTDTKDAYTVQTPTEAYCYYNVMTVSVTPERVMDIMKGIAERAFRRASALHAERLRLAEEKTGLKMAGTVFEPIIVTWKQLKEDCERTHGSAFTAALDAYFASAAGDARDVTAGAVRLARAWWPERRPAIVLLYAPPFYPHRIPEDRPVTVRAAERLIARGYDLQPDYCYNGLTDMSYLSLPEGADMSKLAENLPQWGRGYSLPVDAIMKLNVPFVNLGPSGKDAHKYTERLEMKENFEKLPGTLLELVKELME